MAAQLFRVKGGYSDGLTSTLSGAGAPGGDASFQDAAPIGSTYKNTVDGAQYQKNVQGAGTANWVKQANVTDLAGLSATQSWREPAIVRDSVNSTTAAAITEMNVADTLDGITIAVGDRVLLSQVAGGAGPNVYLVGGLTGAWTLTEDTNLETAGDTLQILQGTSASQVWFFDGTVWSWIGSQSSSEDTYLRAFIGKGAAGAEMPAYTSANYVAQADSLETAIGKLDAQVALNSAAAASAGGNTTALQAELDATQAGAGLATGGGYVADAASNYMASATTLHSATQLLDAQIALNAGAIANEVTNRTNADAALQTEINAIEAGSGLAVDGSFIAYVGTNYVTAATTLANAISLLDTQLGTNSAAINGLDTRLTTAESSIATNSTNIATNTADIATNAANLATEITNRTNGDLALDAKIGDQLYTSNNFVVDGTSSTAAISVLDAAINTAVAKVSALGITAGVVDSVLVDTAEAVKWIVTVRDTTTNDKFSTEIFATHNGTPLADATAVDWSDAFELEIGAAIAGLTIDATLAGTGTAQAMQLSVSSTSTVDVKVTRLFA